MRGLKFVLSSFLIGALSLGLAWAGTVITPPPPGGGATGAPAERALLEAAEVTVTEDGGYTLTEGQILAGAAKASIEPRPDEWGGVWAKEGCATLGPDLPEGAGHALDTRVKWLENSNCIYSGGFDIGPQNGLTEWDQEFGLWARSVALSDGSDTVVLTIVDGAYYFARYRDMCSPNQACGFVDLAESLGAELGIDPSGFMFASSHAHSAPDFIGAWGGVPRWYMNQVTDAMTASVRAAVENMRPAVIEVGQDVARQFNSERRDFYRSAEEDTHTWFRVLEQGAPTPDAPTDYTCATDCPEGSDEGSSASGSDGERGGAATSGAADELSALAPSPAAPPACEHNDRPQNCPSPTPTPEPEPTEDPATDEIRAIATVGAFAAHPTNKGAGPLAHGDMAAVFAQRVEERFGGVGVFFQTGLGNMSTRGDHPEGEDNAERTGFGLAALLPELGEGETLRNGPKPLDITVAQRFWNQPVTNTVLGGGGLVGIFDRPFEQLPATVQAGKDGGRNCKSASPVSVRTSVSAATIGTGDVGSPGNLWITGAPGEIFSNYSNTIKEKNPRGVTLPLALVNDGLGYIMQSFETDHAGRQGLGFVGRVVEYEDAYSIDACFGDMALEATLGLLGQGGTATATP